MKIFTIGFTKSTAEFFFTRLKSAEVKILLDIRLNNISQLAGFAKKNDLEYFLKSLCGISYKPIPELAPTEDILNEYKKNNGDWSIYETNFLNLLTARRVEEKLQREIFNSACLLCSEDKPDFCHRRLVAEYLKDKWSDIEITHL